MASANSFSHEFNKGLDELLLEICEELQLSPARYDQAVARYQNLSSVLESRLSPFREFAPKIYPQGSMALGTTVKPTRGPHDLDFVLELSRDHGGVDPMNLIQTLFQFLRTHSVYGAMTSLKNRCVRIEYANDFYMDVLPACRNGAGIGTFLRVPDCSVRGWADSDPLGYVRWFEERCQAAFINRVFGRAEPVPEQQATEDKPPLHLVVQLLKRWRDLHYPNAKLAPISIVLTTLAGQAYGGQRSVAEALSAVLFGIVQFIDGARAGGLRLRVWHPTNSAEELSERWNNNRPAYEAFEKGIRDFQAKWSNLLSRGGNVNSELEKLFGEPVGAVLKKRATARFDARLDGKLGVNSSGLITALAGSAAPIKSHTFYGDE